MTALLVVVAATGVYAISNADAGFKKYRELAKVSVLCGRLQANMLLTRIQVKNFVINDDLSAIKKYEERLAKTNEFLEVAKVEIQDPRRAEMVSQIDQLIKQYEAAFNEAVVHQTQRGKLMSDQLNQTGPQMESILTSLLGTCREVDDSNTGFHICSALRDLLVARIHVVKFAKTNSDIDRQRVSAEFEKMSKSLDEAVSNTQSEGLANQIAKLQQLRESYVESFNAYVTATEARNEFVVNQLDQIGPQISELAENVKLSVKEDQDELGPLVQASNHQATSLIGIVSVSAMVVAIAITLLLSRMITRPLYTLVDAMERADSQRDLTIQVEHAGNDEIGMIATSFNNFVGGLRKTMQTVSTNTMAVSNASVQLSQTAQELTQGASSSSSSSAKVAAVSEEMNEDMSTIARSTDEMASSVTAVAVAMDQMSDSIRDIAGNTAEASSVACDASALAEQSQGKINTLNDSADEIGKVIGVIQEIAEQTNLLALNATIEAARAGEAGQGFAVVASEVKDLAKQTADATEGIRSRIVEMQGATGEVVAAIEQISESIQLVNQVSTTIASAVEQQSTTTKEISRNMQETSTETEKVAAGVQRSAASTGALSLSIAEVDAETQRTASGAEQTRAAGNDLSELAVELQELVGKFRIA